MASLSPVKGGDGPLASAVHRAYATAHTMTHGATAGYIRPLREADPDKFGVAVMPLPSSPYATEAVSQEGGIFTLGDVDEEFTMQSIIKAFLNVFALEGEYADELRRHVDVEPMGKAFNGQDFIEVTDPVTGETCKRAYNNMVNSGAIATVAHIKPTQTHAERFDYISKRMAQILGVESAAYSRSVMLHEEVDAHRNKAILHALFAEGLIPDTPQNTPDVVLKLYLDACAIMTTVRNLCHAAAVLCSGGLDPVTGKSLIQEATCEAVLCNMHSNGFYDGSGKWAMRNCGVAGKSGVHGGVMVVVPPPLSLAIAVWSPRLDPSGNSIRGMAFCNELLLSLGGNVFSRLRAYTPMATGLDGLVLPFVDAAHKDRLEDMKQLENFAKRRYGSSLIHRGDYDSRTALHLAVAHCRVRVVEWLVKCKADPDGVRDHWGKTPRDECESLFAREPEFGGPQLAVAGRIKELLESQGKK